ncbi:MAG: hypothetical protein ABFS38_20040 [Bacteroidota bacterium]
MERDPKISKLFRESGVEHVHGKFTNRVMDQIRVVPAKNAYRPLIGKTGRFLIVLFIIAMVVVSLLYSDPGGQFLENVGGLSNMEWQLPKINLSFDFLSEINLSTWLVSTLVAVFLLVLSDARLNRRKLV